MHRAHQHPEARPHLAQDLAHKSEIAGTLFQSRDIRVARERGDGGGVDVDAGELRNRIDEDRPPNAVRQGAIMRGQSGGVHFGLVVIRGHDQERVGAARDHLAAEPQRLARALESRAHNQDLRRPHNLARQLDQAQALALGQVRRFPGRACHDDAAQSDVDILPQILPEAAFVHFVPAIEGRHDGRKDAFEAGEDLSVSHLLSSVRCQWSVVSCWDF